MWMKILLLVLVVGCYCSSSV